MFLQIAEYQLILESNQGLLVPAKVPPRARLPPRKPTASIAELLSELDASRAER